MLTAEELQQALKISRSTLYRLRKEGLPNIQTGYRTIRYDLVEVLNWLEKNGHKYGKGIIVMNERLYSKDSNGKEERYYILVESNYNLDVNGKGQPDAVSFVAGQYVEDGKFEIDSVINVSTEEARLFAKAILLQCDAIEGK